VKAAFAIVSGLHLPFSLMLAYFLDVLGVSKFGSAIPGMYPESVGGFSANPG